MARKIEKSSGPEVKRLTADGKAETFEKAVAYFQSDEINSGKMSVEQAVEAAAEKFPKSFRRWDKGRKA